MTEPQTDPNLTAHQLEALLRDEAVTLIDVREPAEFAAEHIEGAVLHPLSRFDPQVLPSGELVFQCGIGKRSFAALQAYQSAGFARARHLAGGLAAWKQAGLPIVRG
jgi:rhodanese-related sulfurtransferase